MDDAEYGVVQRESEEAMSELSASVPAVAQLYREHLDDNGELLPTVFLGDVAAWYQSVYRGTDDQRRSTAEVVNVLDHAFVSGTDTLRNVIATGFLEDLLSPPGDADNVAMSLPPGLREEFDRMRAWRPKAG